jgi:hypothetical protein
MHTSQGLHGFVKGTSGKVDRAACKGSLDIVTLSILYEIYGPWQSGYQKQ